jgi:hypothetical protein
MARLLEAALAWELAVGRTAKADDEAVVQERRQQMDVSGIPAPRSLSC